MSVRRLPRLAVAFMLFAFAGYAATTYLRRIAEEDARRDEIPRASLSIAALRDVIAPSSAGVAEGAGVAKSPEPKTAGRKPVASLGPNPDPKLVERSSQGMLPVVGRDGRRPWRIYARPFSQLDSRARISIVIAGLGVSRNATQSVINTLPGSVSFSFAPYADNLGAWIRKSREAGHEVLIDIPMEPLDYPRSDPGPNTLLANAPGDENVRRLEWALSRATGYVGVATFMGASLAARPEALRPILTQLKTRGLMILDTRENPAGRIEDISREIDLPVAANHIFLDQEPTAAAIEQRLRNLEARALEGRAAIALARPLPVTIRTLLRWLPGLEQRGVVLAPISAMAQTRGNGT
jgi:polysaccharide deacetylase 2 family uncharacterized protein YibQ